MTHLDLVLFYRKSNFKILEGEHKDKQLQLGQVDLLSMEAISRGGLRISVELITPVLKSIDQLSYLEISSIYKLYWGESKTTNLFADLSSGEEKFKIPSKEDIKKIFDGIDYVAGDRKEWIEVMNYCRNNSINFFL